MSTDIHICRLIDYCFFQTSPNFKVSIEMQFLLIYKAAIHTSVLKYSNFSWLLHPYSIYD